MTATHLDEILANVTDADLCDAASRNELADMLRDAGRDAEARVMADGLPVAVAGGKVFRVGSAPISADVPAIICAGRWFSLKRDGRVAAQSQRFDGRNKMATALNARLRGPYGRRGVALTAQESADLCRLLGVEAL